MLQAGAMQVTLAKGDGGESPLGARSWCRAQLCVARWLLEGP